MASPKGFSSSFLGKSKNLEIPYPQIAASLASQIAPVKGAQDPILHYENYSVVQNKERRFPFFSAANIDGSLFKALARREVFPGGRDRWRKDRRLDYKHQWGNELYKAPKSDFDRGHMTKREDVQWGKTRSTVQLAAQSTFYFPNAVPQRPEVNQAIWRSIEDYVLHDETVDNGLKISMFTGPALMENDPVFITPVREEEVRIPTLFWKVIYYTKGDDQLYKVGFMVGQKNLLDRFEIVHPIPRERDLESLFMDFEEADTFQVETTFIEKLTGLAFPEAKEPFKDKGVTKQILQRINVRDLDGGGSPIQGMIL